MALIPPAPWPHDRPRHLLHLGRRTIASRVATRRLPAPRDTRRDERGAVAVMVGVLAIVLFLVAALVVDLGLARDVKRQSQNAADASALAAANVLYPNGPRCSDGITAPPCYSDAVSAAKSYAAVNFGVTGTAWNGCSDASHYYVPPGSSQCISFTDDTLGTSQPSKPTKVRVVVPVRDVKTGLGALAGVTQIPVSTMARATVESGYAGECALCFLGDVTTNNSDFTVEAASIAVNGSISSGPNSQWTATGILVAGLVNGQNPNGYSNSNFNPNPKSTSTFDDPYKDLVMPTTAGLTNRSGTTTCNGTIQPGIYGSLTLGNKDTCTLASGLYVITGRWLEGNMSMITGTGVTLYFTCGTPASVRACTTSDLPGTGGYLDGKNGDTKIHAGSTAFPKFALMYDRLNPNGIYLQGNGGNNGDGIKGVVYAKNADLEFNGNSKFLFENGPVVVKNADSVGNKSGILVKNGLATSLTGAPQPPYLDQ